MNILSAIMLAASLSAMPMSERLPDDLMPPNAPDFEVRPAISSGASTALLNEDFPLIDKMADNYLARQAKTSAGAWKIGLLYDAFEMPDGADELAYKRAEGITLRWQKSNPQSATARIAYAELLISHGYFDQPKLASYVEHARGVLKDCEKICKQDPEWYMVRVQVAKLQHMNEKSFRKLYDEAATKFPDYQRIYFQAAEYFSPLYYGSYDKLDLFIQDALRRSHSLEGTIFYARIYGQILHKSQPTCHCTQMAWPRMFNALTEMTQRYPDLWNYNEFAWQACMEGDRIAMKAMLPKIANSPPFYSVWGSPDILNICKKWATYKFAPPAGSPFDKPAEKQPSPTISL